MAVVNSNFELNIGSFNMKGFHQGFSVVSDLVEQCKPDLFLLQGHWLTSDRLYMFDKFFSGYFNVDSSAMSKTIEKGMLRGRPFGGVTVRINNSLRMVTQTIHCDERYMLSSKSLIICLSMSVNRVLALVIDL